SFFEWSPDGQFLAVSVRPPFEKDAFDIIDASTFKKHLILSKGFISNTMWSPQGNRLASLLNAGDKNNLTILDAAHSTTVTFTVPDDRKFFGLFWSPDGRHVMTMGNSITSYQPLIYGTDGSERRLDTELSLNAVGFPEWAYDSDSIIYWQGSE